MPPKNRTTSTSQRTGKPVQEDSLIEADDAPEIHATPKNKTSKSKQQNTGKESQSTIDKHLLPLGPETIEPTIELIKSELDKLASQDFITEKIKDLVTEKFMKDNMAKLEKELKSEIKKEIDTIHSVIRQVKDSVRVVESDVLDLKNKMSDTETNLDQIQSENKNIKEENRALKEQINEREIQLKRQAGEINDLEQYTRKNSVRVYGLDDKNPKESATDTAEKVVNLVKEKLQIEISTADIDIAHRMGKFKHDANRPVICKFVSRIVKQEVVKARRKLKGSVIVIREDLTIQNAKLLENASSHDSVKSAWSDDGKILALLNNDKKVVITWRTDMDKLL